MKWIHSQIHSCLELLVVRLKAEEWISKGVCVLKYKV